MDKILVADSSALSADLISNCLLPKGYNVLTAENGRQTLVKAQLFAPDLLILDVEFSDISGFDVCRKLKSDPETQYIQILFLCSLETKDARIKALAAGADDLIDKAFDTDILTAKVDSLLRVKHLSNQLKLQYTELEEKNRIYDFQLKMSRQIQQAIMHDFDFSFRGISFASRYLPALDIGGDFYDIIKLNDDNVGVIIGDVSGHGISAALLTAMLNMMTKNLSERFFNPDQFLYHMNNQFYSIFENSNQEIYTCIFYAVIDTKKQKIYYSNAGQVLPIFVDGHSNEVMELTASGLPIGLMKDTTYDFQVRDYHEKDLLMFYTDGLVDVFYKDNPDEFFNQIKALLLEMQAAEQTSAIVSRVVNVFYALNASESEKYALDDVSIIICKM